jgi:hypothetical protein
MFCVQNAHLFVVFHHFGVNLGQSTLPFLRNVGVISVSGDERWQAELVGRISVHFFTLFSFIFL